MSTTTITVFPPSDALFAGVQVEATADGETWRIVGAEPAYVLDDDNQMGPADEVAVACRLIHGDTLIRAGWVHENSTLGVAWTDPVSPDQLRRRRRLGRRR